jgi:galactose-1-phosphate uridylyltransferase
LKNEEEGRALIKFEMILQEARFRSPLQNFEEVTQRVEVRFDPLTGRKCRINVQRARRPKQMPQETVELENLVRKSKERCFFCPDKLESFTPMFPKELVDRIKVGRACVFPNLFPFGGFHAVGTFSDDHYLELNEFTPGLLRDCFAACIRYFELISGGRPELKYWYINWNCLPPGAASIVHPHAQIFADSAPTPFLKEQIEKSREYRAAEGENYWASLIQVEKTKNERYVGESGGTHWIASFAPQGNKEVLAVTEGVSSLAQLRGEMKGFCEGLSRILRGYHELGVRSITFSTYSGPFDEDMSEFYWLNARVIARPHPDPFYVSDCGFMEKLQLEPVIETMPEDLTGELRRHFF